jgi:hypothetical protein
MMECPWPGSSSDTLTAEPAPPRPAGVIDPPRSRIPNCAPPAWKPPAQLRPFVAPELPADRPQPIVNDYLAYVVTAPPAPPVERFRLDTPLSRK